MSSDVNEVQRNASVFKTKTRHVMWMELSEQHKQMCMFKVTWRCGREENNNPFTVAWRQCSDLRTRLIRILRKRRTVCARPIIHMTAQHPNHTSKHTTMTTHTTRTNTPSSDTTTHGTTTHTTHDYEYDCDEACVYTHMYEYGSEPHGDSYDYDA